MPDFSITDSLGNPVDITKVNWTSASSLWNYAKSASLHLAVAPDYVERKDKPLSAAAAEPVKFRLALEHEFKVGGATPEVNITPGTIVTLTANAKAGSDLFDDESFHLPAEVPENTGYAGLSVTGSLDLGVSGSSGDLTFGIDHNSSIRIEYLKAFPLDRQEPTLGGATAAMLSDFVIPASVADLKLLADNDVCAVSGKGSLTVSGGVTVSVPVNPLASVNLPLGVGALAIQGGVLAGLTASLTLTGSYQIRLQKLAGAAIQLSYLKERGTTFEPDLTASAGVSVDLGSTDLLAKLLGTIERGGVDQKRLAGLSADEIGDFTDAIKAGINHSLQASLDLAFSAATDDQAAFQYEIRPDLLNAESTQAVNRALRGDLSLLTALEGGAQADGTIAPGIKLLNSVFSTALNKGASLKVNLLGIVNLISMSNLVSKCEFLFEPASGELTIKETAQSEKIGAITDPLKKQAALRKALYNSALATTTYIVGKTVAMPDLSCEAVHFDMSQKTDKQTIAGYTNWFVALKLMTPDERAGIVNGFTEGGPATCAVRTELNNALCEALFFDGQSMLRPASEYLEIGRQALMGLIDPGHSDIDRIRYELLADDDTWAQAAAMGPSSKLATLIPLSPMDSRFNVVLSLVNGDVYDIGWWADGMKKAGHALQQMRTFLAERDPATLAHDPAFASLRDGLQKQMLSMVTSSKMRFDDPWGIVCLFQAGGLRGASGKLTADTFIIEKTGPGVAATAGQ